MSRKGFHPAGLVVMAIIAVIQLSCHEEADYGPSKNLIFHETFEGPEPFSTIHNAETGAWDYALQFVDSIAQDSDRSARFEIREDQPLVADGKRSEVTVIMSTNENLTKTAWYSFALYLPSTFVSDTTYDVLTQWYNAGSPVRLFTKGDRFFIDIGNESGSKEKIAVGDVTRDQWHEFVFRFYHSPYPDGSVTLWHNGEKKVSHTGGNLYTEGFPKWKIGIYKASFEAGTSLVPSRVVFFDNVKAGNEFASYSDMEPRRP